MKKHLIPIVLVTIGIALLLSGCAQANEYVNTPASNGDTAGFLQGVIQGFIVIVAFVVSLFDPTVGIYEIHNDGAAYNIGFIIGIWLLFGGGTSALFGTRSRRD